MENRSLTFLTNLHAPEHDPSAEGEAFTPAFIPRGPRDIILDYFNNDILPIKTIKKEKNTVKQYADFKLFGRGLHFFIDCKLFSEFADSILLGEERTLANILNKSADFLLLGEEKGISRVCYLVEEQPILLRIITIGKDRLNRRVQGTLLQIAAMAGDVSLSSTDKGGLVERLKLAGKLTNEEVRDHLEVVTGSDAKLENEKRNQRVLQALEKFVHGFLQIKISGISEFQDFKKKCIPLIEQFDNDLQIITKEPITKGYVFDPEIICKAAKIFAKNIKAFGGWYGLYSAMFRINGFGMLQRHLSARDAQVVRNGMDNYIEKHLIAGRFYDLWCSDYPSHQIGYDYYANYQGEPDIGKGCDLLAPASTHEMQIFSMLVANKKKSIEALTKVSEHRSVRSFLGFK